MTWFPFTADEGRNYDEQIDGYAEIVRTSRIEAIVVDRIEALHAGELVIFTSHYPNSDPTRRVAYVKNGNKVWNMIAD